MDIQLEMDSEQHSIRPVNILRLSVYIYIYKLIISFLYIYHEFFRNRISVTLEVHPDRIQMQIISDIQYGYSTIVNGILIAEIHWTQIRKRVVELLKDSSSKTLHPLQICSLYILTSGFKQLVKYNIPIVWIENKYGYYILLLIH